jgi:hypothetical protein
VDIGFAAIAASKSRSPSERRCAVIGIVYRRYAPT